MSFGIRGKLISIFLIIKVIPLVLLGGVAWEAIKTFGDSAIEQSQTISAQMRQTISEAGDLAVADTVKALDTKAREAIERLTTDTARDVARFLYERDSELLFAANLQPDEKTYQSFLNTRTKHLSQHGEWKLNEAGDKWVPQTQETNGATLRTAKVEKNKKDFHYRPAEGSSLGVKKPIYLEMTYIGLDGQEKVKITTSELMDQARKDVSKKENTFLKAESYFSQLQGLKAGEIYVSDVIGSYVPSKMIGPYTKARTDKANMAFEPGKSAYAGKENPLGKRFEGIVRWATPVVKNGEKIGYVSLALDHAHIMEFSDHIIPTEERYSDISDAASGNYAFMWDYKGRNISHPRDYFIVGYDPKTGDPSVPWLTKELYEAWQKSGKSYAEFEKTAPTFKNPGEAKPSIELKKQGKLALDCRFLNFAPQCAGWMNLTQEGGSGSFVIFWSGLWKLTTAATIPYYTGQYANSKRGFGFVTIGANVDEFHRAATETKASLDQLIMAQETKANLQEKRLLDHLKDSITQTASELSVYTGIMIVIVIIIAIWMASVLSSRITNLIGSLRKIQGGDLSERAKVESGDEMGELASSLNNMTESLQELIEENKTAVKRAEASNQAKSDFLASMSHELRTPLNAIIGFSEVIQSEVYGPVRPNEYKDYINDINNSGQHLLTLINDVLDVARIGSGEMEIQEDVLDLNETIEECVRMIHPIVEHKDLKVDYQKIDLPSYYGDKRRIKQVVLNLLSNATKFTHAEGNIALKSVILPNGDIEIRVKDSGIGMTAEEVEIALTPFAQVQSSLSREYEGTGLGLPLSHNLVEMHGGKLDIKSTPNEGTEVIVTLPKERVRD
ncbi:conserved membrane hypothetical protein [Candidatus Terasakiella magnetica]|uniref:histidine kinase n=1 Tax=Candidatus Terasakiella magnetica TaxID=1867952 RepID=A0A1C3RIZ1_9PROT|nr:ATP-binding protein [Candidatus Terasakiella magnetica]SCA57231.1 conserved membrane hypothetical protein [Candidatus Terasakiella magnetica]